MSKSYNITVLPGDGIGPEIIREALKVLDKVAAKFEFGVNLTEADFGGIAIEKTNTPLPPETLKACEEADAVLLGAIGLPKYDNNPLYPIRPEQGLLALRKSLGLYGNVRPVTTYPSLIHLSPIKADRLAGVDFVVYRELTGGIYFGEKDLDIDQGTAYDTCMYHAFEIERIAKWAFEAAQKRRNKLTLIDKANVLSSSKLWRHTIAKMAEDYPNIKVDYLFVDNAAMQMILNPSQFDVIVTGNMFGDIISDEASVITGSLGLLPSSSIGVKNALFEPVHGSYPQVAGQNIANPIATILSVAMMMDYLGEGQAAESIRSAVNESFNQEIGTKDLYGTAGVTCSEAGDFICAHL